MQLLARAASWIHEQMYGDDIFINKALFLVCAIRNHKISLLDVSQRDWVSKEKTEPLPNVERLEVMTFRTYSLHS
jgi:hypothetical protein